MVCSNVHPIWGQITEVLTLLFPDGLETTNEFFFPWALLDTSGNWELTHVSIDHGGVNGGAIWIGNNQTVQYILITCEPQIPYPKYPDPSKVGILRALPLLYRFKPFHWSVQ